MYVYIERNNMEVELIRFSNVFKCLCSLQHVSRVSRKYCVQIVEICTFMNGGNVRGVSPLFNAAVRTESRSNMCMFDKRQFDSNFLLFTPFLTV